MDKVITVINEMLQKEKEEAISANKSGNLYKEEIAVDTMATLKEVAERLDVLEEVKHNLIF